MKPSLKSIFFGEGTVPQGSADERPLHGAPTYYYPTGRSLPKHLQDRGGKSSARKWNEDGSLLDVDELEDKQEKKKRWYDKETKNESVGVDQKGSKLSLGTFRQDSIGSTSASEKSSRTTSSGRARKGRGEARLKEFNALSTAAIKASNTPPGSWDRDDAPRVDQKKIKANKAYVKKLDVTSVEAANGTEVHVDHMDPQYKRQISMLKSPEDVIEWKEPNYLEGRGEHRISQLGYAKIADRQGDLKMDVYLAPYDPNWKRSEDMMQQVIKHWIANHGNPKRIMPEPDATMMVSIKEAWEDLRDTFKEYYPHDPAVNYHETEPGVEGEFYSITEDYYHGTNKEFAPGDYIMPPSETGEISEKGRKKNLDKVFFTLDKGSAKIYAGRAVQSFGSGSPNIYKVQPIGDIEWLNKQKGTTVLMAPMAKVVEKVSSQ